MYSIDQISNATAQLTGESLGSARLRLATLDRFDELVPRAWADQALLESVLLCALGTVQGQTRPFGVREAKPEGAGLVLRLERAMGVEALLGLLPYRTKRGPWRGVRGLLVQTEGSGLRFGLRFWLRDQSWGGTRQPEVWVSGPHGEDLAALLAAHERRLVAGGHAPQWEPGLAEPGPKRQEPVTRSLVRQLTTSSSLGSALVRRPRLWDSLSAYAGIEVGTRMSDHGLDWIVNRSVAGPDFEEDRLIGVLTDHVVGCGLRLLDHYCDAGLCTVRFTPPPGAWRSRGILTVRSSRVPGAPRTQAAGPRPLTVLGEPRGFSRPRTGSISEGKEDRDHAGTVIQLTGKPRTYGIGREELSWIAEQIAAVWAAQGLSTAVVLARDEPDRIAFGDPTRPSWATDRVPSAAAGWHRLRITPPPGKLWTLAVPEDNEMVATALKDARRRFDRILLVGRNDEWAWFEHSIGQFADVRVLVHPAARYERRLPLPTWSPDGETALDLTPDQSAILWRQQELGLRPPRRLAGLLLIEPAGQATVPEGFDAQVEEQLARYGTPVLGRFPANGPIAHGPGHSPHAPTVMDPKAERPTHEQMITATEALDRRLWSADPDQNS
ncbi:hypothetical protein [Streptomyces sp. CFMR 7]|uniref:hypothetical protein n=1 Tax=Streptomyces sp. CFMR 7 TaxID=1649184 RepID=UPI0006AD1FC0|nr:hypothetical protein [Streptomyces sp. CFMR 7]ALC25679.1 hypothetical protein ABE83_00155 [Streptomyces sp. CFMR 7]